MSIFTRDKVWFSADKRTYLQYDEGAGAAYLYVEDTKVATFTAAGGFAPSQSIVPTANGTLDLGSASYQIDDIFMDGVLTFGAGATINADSGTASCTTNAATLSKMAGKITTESLTTAAQGQQTITVTNTTVAAADIVLATLANGSNTQGVAVLGRVTPAAGSFTVSIENQHASQAFNGTFVISFLVIKA